MENLAMIILGVGRNTDKKPNPMREQIPILIRKLIWTLHKKTIGRAAKAKSQNADDTDFVNYLELIVRVVAFLLGKSPPWNIPIAA